jgi:hypothetical protein
MQHREPFVGIHKMEHTSKRQDNPNDYSAHRDIARWTRVVGIFTALLFIVSSIADFFIWSQFRVANEQQRDAREQLRAIVIFTGGDIVTVMDSSTKAKHYLFIQKFQNAGATRTYTFIAWNSIHYFPGEVPYSQDFSKPWSPVTRKNSIIGPNSQFLMPPVAISNEDAEGAASQKGKIIIWGHAEWSDIFEKEIIHPIGFCEIMQPVIDNGGNISFRALPYKTDCNSGY